MGGQEHKKFDQLVDWLKANKMSQAEFGRRIGRPAIRIHRIVHGRVKFIDPAEAVAIESETRKGKNGRPVTAADFITFVAERDREAA